MGCGAFCSDSFGAGDSGNFLSVCWSFGSSLSLTSSEGASEAENEYFR